LNYIRNGVSQSKKASVETKRTDVLHFLSIERCLWSGGAYTNVKRPQQRNVGRKVLVTSTIRRTNQKKKTKGSAIQKTRKERGHEDLKPQ